LHSKRLGQRVKCSPPDLVRGAREQAGGDSGSVFLADDAGAIENA